MAGDTRDPTRDPTISRSFPPSSSPPTSPPKTYETFSTPPLSPTPPQSANILPEGSGQNTAGSPSHKPLPSLAEAVKTVRLEDFKQVHMYPCVRESLLLGIGAGFGVGGVRALLGAPIPKVANWAVGVFVFGSWANYEFCLYRRTLERAHMKRAVEIIDRKKGEKEEEARVKREERRRLKEEVDRREEEMRPKKEKGWRGWIW